MSKIVARFCHYSLLLTQFIKKFQVLKCSPFAPFLKKNIPSNCYAFPVS